jgi:hypothetical protein
MQAMYPAMVNSPEVITRGALTTSTTQIQVSDSGIFTAVSLPFPLTLGKGSTAETVLLTVINGDILTVVRGFQGTPRSWDAGTLISRNFTAYDHDAFKANIEGLSGEQSSHLAATMPHVFVGSDSKTYRYGFKADSAGSLIFIYEEVQ